MLTDWFEPFTLLEAAAEPDGLCGCCTALHEVTVFRGVLSHETALTDDRAHQPIPRVTPVLLHELDVTLGPGDYVRREKTGAVYRVTGRTEDMRAPAFSSLQFAQVPVESVVIPC